MSTTSTPPNRAVPWLISLVLVLAAALAVVLLTPVGTMLTGSLLGARSEVTSSQVIESVTLEEEVVLLGLNTQGITSQETSTTFGGLDLPGTTRESYIRYTLTAKLGIDGRDVAITESGENAYVVEIPDFIYIGEDDTDYEVIVEENGLLSWVTPDVDVLELASDLPTQSDKAEYLRLNDQALRDQAEVFYGNIIASIDPDADVTFEFASSGAPSR